MERRPDSLRAAIHKHEGLAIRSEDYDFLALTFRSATELARLLLRLPSLLLQLLSLLPLLLSLLLLPMLLLPLLSLLKLRSGIWHLLSLMR